MLATIPALSAPMAIELGSLNAVPGPAGVGVAGTGADDVAVCDGAAGGAGVATGARAGVPGTLLVLDEEAAGAGADAGAGLGWDELS